MYWCYMIFGLVFFMMGLFFQIETVTRKYVTFTEFTKTIEVLTKQKGE